MITIEDLRVTYGERVAVDDVSLAIGSGEFFGLLGPNGAGKTSLIGSLTGLVDPAAGTISMMGLDPRRDRRKMARRIGFVPQELAFYPTITARQNLVFFGRVQDLWGAALSRAVDRALELVGLTARADERAATFSGGMKRRLNLAIGLLHEPGVLILDEPTVGVDAQSRAALLECFGDIGAGRTTVLYTTHLMEEAERLCDRVAIIDAGRIVIEGPPADLIARVGRGALIVELDRAPPAPFMSALGCDALIQEVQSDGRRVELAVDQVEPALTRLAAHAAHHGLAIASIDHPRPSLENVFLRLTGRRLRDVHEGAP